MASISSNNMCGYLGNNEVDITLYYPVPSIIEPQKVDYELPKNELFDKVDAHFYQSMPLTENGEIEPKKVDYELLESELYNKDEVDETYYDSTPLTENAGGAESKKVDDESVNEFIAKLAVSDIFPPNHSADEIMVTALNKEGLPKRSMNCFFVFRNVVYREVLKQKLIEEIKDGVFFTQVVSVMWKKASEENREKYKGLATEIKSLQNEYHKDKTYSKNKQAGSIFVNMNGNNFQYPEHKIKKTKTKKDTTRKKTTRKSKTNPKNNTLQVYQPSTRNLDLDIAYHPFVLPVNYHNPLDNNYFPCNPYVYDFPILNETFSQDPKFLYT
ncbi:hypothetical protein RclHR1_00990016 [Rhizophagus clarus]|uniref:HMG box domain-containing protein n=1 Tax=Rhizophagus clarus TaxID=94130 RepID=A0A2Z6SBP6_9GLOM|nr:hypothetical protein RclHR1_00990016 [Rhizophagus clarus]GES78760.1 hypothetical protein GLOIN_2v1701663 [Rhizophagus clarus]